MSFLVLLTLLFAPSSEAAVSKKPLRTTMSQGAQKTINSAAPIFDIPITYNNRVQKWIRYFQTSGRRGFKKWLARSSRYSPHIQRELSKAGLPKDIMYTAMIESGFSPKAESHAAAVGIWQFIKPTAERYGLKVNWWLDERRNYVKSTRAAIKYKSDLYAMFRSWYLVAASYNCGERRIERIINKYGTNNFWEISDMGLLPKETIDYVPKIIAATLIARAPGLYGFRKINYQVPYKYERTHVRGGTDLYNLALFLGVSPKYLQDLNPELLHGFVPASVKTHKIMVPIGSRKLVAKYNRSIHKKL